MPGLRETLAAHAADLGVRVLWGRCHDHLGAPCSEQAWRSHCKDEGWSVGVTAHHMAATYPLLLEATRTLTDGGTLPPNLVELGDRFNAEHARDHANCTREETVALLRRGGETVAAFIRGLSDAQLDRNSPTPFFGNAEWTVQQWIENTSSATPACTCRASVSPGSRPPPSRPVPYLPCYTEHMSGTLDRPRPRSAGRRHPEERPVRTGNGNRNDQALRT